MALRDAIKSLTRLDPHDYVVTRTTAGEYDAATGLYVRGAVTTFMIEASIQPSSGRDLQSLPDGERTTESRTVYTKTILKTRTQTTEPDEITIDGETWVVKTVPTWRSFGQSHCVAIIQRQGIK